jgi:hypothetical protein
MVDYGWGPVNESSPAAAAPGTQYGAPRKKTDPAASMAFALSLLGIFTWGLSCVVALVVAWGARRNIAVSPETRKGKGFILAANIISGWTLLIAAVAAIAVFAS